MDETGSAGGQMLALAQTLTGASESEQALLKMICSAQELILERALRGGVTKEACGEAFVCAGAFLAAAAMESARACGEEISSLRAGEMSVTLRPESESGARAERLRKQAWALMRPYTTDGGFCFRGVEA